jgi:3-deoxy-D-manno-octulosonic-acid transferase
VGGGYGKGLHNILEPAIYEHPIIIGPNFEKFNEAVQLVNLGCAFSTKNEENIDDLVSKLTINTNTRKEISEKISSYISINTNVSEKIAVYIKKNSKL